MGLSPVDECKQCGLTLSYVDEKGTLFRSMLDHSKDECASQLKDTIKHLRNRVLELDRLLNEERTFGQRRIIRAPRDQKTKLLDQIQRWKNMLYRERMRRWKLKKEIMYIYGTLDFQVETGTIVDDAAKLVAESISRKLQALIRKSNQ